MFNGVWRRIHGQSTKLYIDECKTTNFCGTNSKCFNTIGGHYCQCEDGYESTQQKVNFTAAEGQCKDYNECINQSNICKLGNCTNLIGSFVCTCPIGYNFTSKSCTDINECLTVDLCGKNGTCENTDGSYWCVCQKGYTNYGKSRTLCSELDCESFDINSGYPAQSLGGLANILFMMRNSCLALSNLNPAGEDETNGEMQLENFFTAIDATMPSGHLNSSQDVSILLQAVEDSIRYIIGPQLKHNHNKIETSETDAEIAMQRGETRPTGPIQLTSENAILNTDWTTASGNGTYPGFALAALVTYKNLERSVNTSFEELKGLEKDGFGPILKISSKVVSVVVSNPSTQSLSRPVNITLRHLKETDEPFDVSYVCAYWNERGAWSNNGCYQKHSNATHTVCTCEHLSSFAVLMALYPMEHTFGLKMVTKIGLIISLLCLIMSILTFIFSRSIQGTRTTIHLHLCVCLFIADLIFLAGISQTKPLGGCRFVAAMLHIFFLGVFMWMLLEGVQLYRMVVLVFNATIRPLYLFIAGYGTPLVIVIISAIIRPQRYGTEEYCWLSLKDGFIWSFYGPVCAVIFFNVFFFIITVWKLAQKFTSLNPDLSQLNKIKAFTVTAVAQMCVLGLMWVFGAFIFEESIVTTVAAYIFTVLNSLQGALIFIMHCLLSKQVRDEYAHFLSRICTSQKRYSDFSSTVPSSSQSQGSQSGQQTGESQI
ncbi:hypothetical protein PAMA_016108 [Pampus argenteus]